MESETLQLPQNNITGCDIKDFEAWSMLEVISILLSVSLASKQQLEFLTNIGIT